MLSFEQGYTNVQRSVQDFDSDALTFIKAQYNIGLHILESELGSFYTEETITRTTTASNGIYALPADFVRLKQAYLVISSTQYNLEEVFTEDLWQALQASYYGSYNDEATHIFCRRDKFEIFPGAENAGNTITLRYEAGGKDLQHDDYTEGNISALTNGATTVTGSGTTFTAAMVGRYFKVDSDNSWYKIDSFTSTTEIELDRPYEGITIAAGSENYTIGEMPRTPGPTHHIPGLYAEWQYYQGFKQNDKKAGKLERQYLRALKIDKETYGKRYSSNYIPGRKSSGETRINPNYPPRKGSIS